MNERETLSRHIAPGKPQPGPMLLTGDVFVQLVLVLTVSPVLRPRYSATDLAHGSLSELEIPKIQHSGHRGHQLVVGQAATKTAAHTQREGVEDESRPLDAASSIILEPSLRSVDEGIRIVPLIVVDGIQWNRNRHTSRDVNVADSQPTRQNFSRQRRTVRGTHAQGFINTGPQVATR